MRRTGLKSIEAVVASSCLLVSIWAAGSCSKPWVPPPSEPVGETGSGTEQPPTDPAAGGKASLGSKPTTVSESAGKKGGVVVLWPRVIPSKYGTPIRMLSAQVQRHMAEMVGRVLPGRSVDVRPEPQRVCPQGGCDGVAFGVLLVHHGDGCAAVAFVGERGRSHRQLFQWAGNLRLKATLVPFRNPPENYVTIADYAPCNGLVEAMALRQDSIIDALRLAAIK